MSNGRGGPRKGAGRKPIGETRTVSVTLPPRLWKLVDQESNKTGVAVRTVIEAYFAEKQLTIDDVAPRDELDVKTEQVKQEAAALAKRSRIDKLLGDLESQYKREGRNDGR